MSERRRTLVLLAVFLLLAGYFVWMRWGADSGPSATFSRGGPASVGAAPEVEELQTARLERKPGVYRQGRNLFGYAQPRRAEPPRRPSPPPPPPPRPSPEPTREKPPAPQPPPIDIDYLGSFGRPGRRIAVFSDAENVYNALVGDVIKEKFILVAIGYESADIEFVGFPEVAPRRLAAGGLR